MPVKSVPRERSLIELFLSAYDNGSWNRANREWVEMEQDGAVEVVATRSDGAKLTLEHTLIQLFGGEKRDSSRLVKLFSPIERSPELVVPGRNLVVFIPIRALTKGYIWEKIGEELLSWLISNHAILLEGYSEHKVLVGSSSKKGLFALPIAVRITTHAGMSGCCLVSSRDRVPWDLGSTVEKALKTKLPKLVNSLPSERIKRILLLERDQIPPAPKLIYDEVVKRQATFPDLAKIDEIWFVNTAFYDTRQSLYFVLIDGCGEVETLIFRDGALKQRLRNRP